MRLKWCSCLAVLMSSVAAFSIEPAVAQAYPAKPIRLVLSAAAGVTVDVVMRAASAELATQMGQPWVVENYPGGNFVIGANACKHSAADGYSVCVVTGASMSLNPHIIAKLSYDPDKDFRPVTNLLSQVTALVAVDRLSVNSVADLRSLAVAKRGMLNFGTLGVGSNADILRQWLSDRWETTMVGVPYKNVNLILNAMLADQIDLAWAAMGNAAGQVKAGRIKMLAINTSKRFTRAPNVPTLAEAGLGDFPGVVWWGLVAPAGVTDAIVQRLNAELARVFRNAKFADYLERQFVESAIDTPDEFAAFLKADRERAGQLVRKFNIPKQ